MSEYGATDYDDWFHQYGQHFDPDADDKRDEAEDAAYMAALEEVYQQTLIHVGRVEEHSRQIQNLAGSSSQHID